MIHKVTFVTTQSKNDHFCAGLTAACLQDLIPRGKENGKLMVVLFIARNLSRVRKKRYLEKSKVHGQFKTIQRSRKECNLLDFDGYRKVGIFSR